MSLKSATCEDVIPLLDAYHDGELDLTERQCVSSHLDGCQNCQTKLKGIESVVTSLKSLPPLQMPHDLTTSMDFLKQAFEIAGCKVDSGVESIRNPLDLDQAVEPLPIPREIGSHRFLNRLFPIPGPVIFASVAAAAALTLVILVPRMLNTSMTGPTTIATLPKQPAAMLDLNHREADYTTGSSAHNNRIEHNVTTSLSQYGAHDAAHNASAANEVSNLTVKESHIAIRPQELARATNIAIPPSTDKPEIDLAPGEIRSLGQVESYRDEKESPTSVNSADTGDLLALYPGDSNPTNNELAISTDEDGLYALKL